MAFCYLKIVCYARVLECAVYDTVEHSDIYITGHESITVYNVHVCLLAYAYLHACVLVSHES